MRSIPTAESLTVEFKSDKGGLPDGELVLAVVCLANTQGGRIYLGVEDNGRITGVTARHVDPSGMAAVIFNNTQPPQSVRVSILQEEGHNVAEVQVDRSDRPVSNTRGTYQRRRLKSDGTPECAPFLSHEFATRASDLGLLDYSALPVRGATMADLNPLERVRLRQAVEKYRGDAALVDLDDAQLDGALGLVADGQPTVAGLLLLGHEAALRRHLPTHEVAFQVLGADLSVAVNDFYRGPLIDVFERVEQQFLARLNEAEVQVGLFRVPVPDVDRRAFREALVNAVTHRDYTRLGATHVQWTPDALSISNPGGFVEGVTAENLLATRPRPRNLVLADAFKRIGLAERTGRGVDLIFHGLLRYGRPPPSYRLSDATSVTVELPCASADLAFLRMILAEEQRRGAPLPLDALLVLSRIRQFPRSSAEALANALHRDAAVAGQVAEHLVEAGLLAPQAGHPRTYTLSPSAYRAIGKKAASVHQAGVSPLERTELVRTFVEQHGQIKRAEAADLCHLDTREAGRLLTKLTKEGVLVRTGDRKAAVYRLGHKQ